MKYHYKMCYVILLPPFLDLFLLHCENEHKKVEYTEKNRSKILLLWGKKTQLHQFQEILSKTNKNIVEVTLFNMK